MNTFKKDSAPLAKKELDAFSNIQGVKINLGCGVYALKGWVNVDKYRNKGVDIAHDLNKIPYPFKSNYADIIVCDNVLEHLKEDLDKIMKELYRILKPKGKLVIIVPHGKSTSSIDPFHHKNFRAFNFLQYRYLNPEKNEWIKNFKVKKVRIRYYKFLKKIPLIFAFLEYLINSHPKVTYFFEFTGPFIGIDDIYVELEKSA